MNPNSNKPHINTFIKGMDKDTANTKYEQTKYTHAENLRLLTEDGKSTGAMINVQGNEKLLTLHKVVILKGEIGSTTQVVFRNTINNDGWTTTIRWEEDGILFFSYNTQGEDLKTWLENNNVITYIKSDQLVFEFPSDSTVTYEQVISANNVKVKETSKHIIIGSTNLRDDIILFSTEDETDEGGPGYIWRVTYDKATFEPTVKLIFADYALNFSTRHLIEAAARYETDKIEGLYWTDNYNSIRTFNILEEGLWQRRINSIELNPEVTLVPAKCTRIGKVGSGKLDTGTYQMSYRLGTFAGQKTELAPWSVPISVNGSPEEAEYWNYKRSSHTSPDANANKSLEFNVSEVTEGFELMEVFLLKRGSTQGILYAVDTIYLQGSSDPVNVSITGSEGQFKEISIKSIEEANATFNVCKTLTIKDNRLIVGNVKSRATFIDYDASAPRYRPKNPADLSQGWEPHEKYNNPYNRDSTKDLVKLDRNYRSYLVNGNQTSTNALGGGNYGTDNVTYSFVTKQVDLDNYEIDLIDINGDKRKYPFVGGIKKNLSNIIFNDGLWNEERFYAGNLWNNFKNPYIENLLKGYQRDEVYRFGILFYDKSSRPQDVKWIGDIRMPAEFDGEYYRVSEEIIVAQTNPIAGSNPPIYLNTTKELKGNVLGLKFTVNIESVKDKISGFSIVRAPRPNKDKTILAQGMLGECMHYEHNPYFVSNYHFSYKTWVDGGAVTPPTDNYYLNMIDNAGTFNVDPDDLGRVSSLAVSQPRGNAPVETRQDWLAKWWDGNQRGGGVGEDYNYYQYDWDLWLKKRYCIAPYTPLNLANDGYKRFIWMGKNVDGVNKDIGAPIKGSGESRKIAWMASPDLENGTGLSTGYGKIVGNDTEGLANAYAVGLRFKPLRHVKFDTPAVNKEILKNTHIGNDPQKLNNGIDPTAPSFKGWVGAFSREDSGTFEDLSTKHNSQTMRWRVNRGYGVANIYNPWTHSDPNKRHWYVGITDGIIPNDYADNFLAGNETSVTKLGLDTTKWFYQSIEAASRSNFAALPLLKGATQWSDVATLWSGKNYPWNDLANYDYSGRASAGYPITVGNIYIENDGQYGGSDKNDIANTTYISTGHYQKVDENTPNIVPCEVFGGDTMVTLHEQNLTYPSSRIDTPIGDVVIAAIYNVGDAPNKVAQFHVEHWSQWEFHLKELVKPYSHNYTSVNYPIETTVNNSMTYNKSHNDYVTKGELETRSLNSTSGTWNIYNSTEAVKSILNSATNKHDVWPFHVLPGGQLSVYQWENTFRDREKKDFANFQRENYAKQYYAFPDDVLVSSEFDNRIYASEAKKNGEQSDNWIIFKAANFLDVDGHHGPINKLEVFNDTPFYFQDTGFGQLVINPKTLMTSPSGSQLLLGTGNVLNDFKYISTEIGSRHQWAIIKSKTGVYFFDAASRKFYRTRGSSEPLSDMKGLSAFFYNNITKSALTYDNQYHEGGIIGTFDPRYSEVIFTFHDKDLNALPGSVQYSSPAWLDDTFEPITVGTNNIETLYVDSAWRIWDSVNQDLTNFNANSISPETEWLIDFTHLPVGSISDTTPNQLQTMLQSVNNGEPIRLVVDGYGTGGNTVASFSDPTEVEVLGFYLVTGQYANTIDQHAVFNPPCNNLTPIEIDYNTARNIYDNGWSGSDFYTKPIVLMKVRVPQSNLLERLRAKMKAYPTQESRGIAPFVFDRRTFSFYKPSDAYSSIVSTETIPVLDRSSIVFSEAIDAFTGFYSFAPKIFVRDDAKYFSPDPDNPQDLYIHNKGQKCVWYNGEAKDSILTFVVNPKGYNSKVFNNVEFLTQVVNAEGENILQESFNYYTIENEYQSVTKELVPYTQALVNRDQLHMRRRMRSWRLQIPRNGDEKARIRNPYTTMSFTYNNNEDKEITINDIITYYMDVPM